MANNVDKRIVEMQFDNAQFENGVRTSTQSLEKLKQGLDFSGVENSTSKLSNSLKLSGVTENVDKTASSFQKLKSNIPNVMKTAGKAMLGFGAAATGTIAGIGTALTGLTIKGGITRAMNLKQADFMLQGLVKDEKAVEAIMDNVQASVDGTAYSLDQAALVASQFAATGMRGGEQMENALKGVAGAAAVFGADYQRIGQIFTQVSGQGRLMGNDLLQLSSYGMNAAATLADYFREVKKEAGTTEADIRDMVSKGKIDFQTFAEAMNWAFGDQAAKANETFSGALANLKSAFSRIGEKIASPVIDSLRDLFNSLRPIVNTINAQLTPALDSFGKKVTEVSDKVTGFIDKLSGSEKVTSKILDELDYDSYGNIADYLKKVHDGSVQASDDITKLANSFKNSDDITDKSVKNLVNNRKISFDTLKKSTDEATKSEIAYSYLLDQYSTKDKKASEKLAEYFNNVNNGSQEASKNIKETIKDLTTGKKITAETAEELVKQEKITYELLGNALGKNIWESPLHDISIVGMAFRSLKNIAWSVKDVFDVLKKAFLEVFPPITIDTIRNLSDKFLDFSYKARLSEDTLNNLHNTFRGLFSFISLIGKGFGVLLKFLSPLLNVLKSLGGLFFSITGRIGNAIYKINEMADSSKSLTSIFEFLASIGSAVSEIFSAIVGSITDVLGVSTGLKDLTKSSQSAGTVVGKAFSKMSEGMRAFGKGASDAIHGINFDFIKKVVSAGLLIKLGQIFNKMIDLLVGGVKQIKSAGLGAILDEVRLSLVSYQAYLKADILIKIATAVAILTGSLVVLSMIDTKKLASGLGAIAVLMFELTGALSLLMTTAKGAKGIIGLSSALLLLSIAIAIMAGALNKVSKLSLKELGKGLLGLAGISIILVGVAKALSKSSGRIVRGSGAIILFAIAINELTGAVQTLGNMNVKKLAKGLIGVGVLVGELSLLMSSFSNGGGIVKAVGILVLAHALVVLSDAVSKIGGENVSSLVKSIVAIKLILLELSAFSKTTKNAGSLIISAAGIYILAKAMTVFANVISVLGGLSIKELSKGILSLGGALLVIGKSMKAMPKNLVVTGAGLVIVAGAINILANALISMSGMSMGEIGKSLISLGGGLIIIAGAMKLMQGSISGAAAMLVMAAAIRVFTPAMVALSSLSLAQIGIGLLGLAGAFAVLGLAGALLSPLVPAIIALAGAVSLIGLAAALAGAGVALFATGLASLATISLVSVDNIVKVIENLAKSIPEVFKYIGEGIVELIKVIGDNAVAFAEVGLQLITGFLSAINNNIYRVTTLGIQIVTNFINAVAENIEPIIQSGINLMVAFINGLAQGVRDNQELILGSIANLMAAILEFVITALEMILGEIPVFGGKIVDGLEGVKKSIDEKFNATEGKKSSKNYGKGLDSGLQETGKNAKKSGEKIAKNVTDGMGKSDGAKKAAEKLGLAYNNNVGKNSKNSKSEGEKYPANVLKGMSLTKGIDEAGKLAGTDFLKGLEKPDAKSAGKGVASNSKSGMGSVSGYSGLGSSAAGGFVSGAGSKNSSAYSAGWSLASSYYNAIKSRLSIKSPSKETYKLALYAIQGFIKPAYECSNVVRKAGESISYAMLNGIKKSSNDIGSELKDLDIIPEQPVIKPVVDLSNVTSAAGNINSIFSNTRSLNAAASIQNSMTGNALYKGIDKLTDKIDKIGDSTQPTTNYINMKVDGTENPENFARRFVRQVQLEMRTV